MNKNYKNCRKGVPRIVRKKILNKKKQNMLFCFKFVKYKKSYFKLSVYVFLFTYYCLITYSFNVPKKKF